MIGTLRITIPIRPQKIHLDQKMEREGYCEEAVGLTMNLFSALLTAIVTFPLMGATMWDFGVPCPQATELLRGRHYSELKKEMRERVEPIASITNRVGPISPFMLFLIRC